jgi:lysophospholipid acyltransferase (LPLAT)-like uncharacterized protein
MSSIARQWHSKHAIVTAVSAHSKQTITEELLEIMFSVQSDPGLYSELLSAVAVRVVDGQR